MIDEERLDEEWRQYISAAPRKPGDKIKELRRAADEAQAMTPRQRAANRAKLRAIIESIRLR